MAKHIYINVKCMSTHQYCHTTLADWFPVTIREPYLCA
ncbi:hypothetical protein HPTD01_2421 [Halomonas sp. TD01]|nr:hypothetical protein HPTD01_2421 [Halomonas sp. TD01]